MLKKIQVLTLFLLSISYLSAQIFDSSHTDGKKNDFHISVEPVISYSTGHLGEIMYHSSPSDKKISYLEWERDIFLFGANILVSYKNLHVEGGIASSVFDQNSGIMEDSDWLNTNDYSMKTTFSTGDNEAVENYEANFSVSYDFDMTEWLTFSPVLNVRYYYDSFERRSADGWYTGTKYSSDGQYHWWYDNDSTHFPYSVWSEEKGRYVTYKLGGIDFYRYSFFTLFGFKAKFSPFKRLNIDFSVLLSPFSHFYAVDSHTAQDSTTKEKYKKHYRQIQFSYFNVLSLGIGANFYLNKIFDISLRTNYLFNFDVARGTLYADTFYGVRQDGYHNTGQDSGMEFENFTVSLGCKIKIR